MSAIQCHIECDFPAKVKRLELVTAHLERDFAILLAEVRAVRSDVVDATRMLGDEVARLCTEVSELARQVRK